MAGLDRTAVDGGRRSSPEGEHHPDQQEVAAPSPITHFEIYGSNPEKLADFYRKVLGWSIGKANGVDYWRVEPARAGVHPLGGGITYRPDGAPSGWLCYAQVASLDNSLALVVDLGGKILRPKTAIPKTAWYAMVADCEGNVFSLWQPDRTAFPPLEAD